MTTPMGPRPEPHPEPTDRRTGTKIVRALWLPVLGVWTLAFGLSFGSIWLVVPDSGGRAATSTGPNTLAHLAVWEPVAPTVGSRPAFQATMIVLRSQPVVADLRPTTRAGQGTGECRST